MNSTQSEQYAEYLISHQKSWKGRIFQIPYRTHLKVLGMGKTLDVGCGAGRNLQTLGKTSVGIDHNPILVHSCRKQGLTAYTTDEWGAKRDDFAHHFDSILFSHVAEHMSMLNFQELLSSLLSCLKPGGKVVVICPQELGYQTDNTHVEFMDFKKIHSIFSAIGIITERQYSFPFLRPAGKFFPYNEFVSVGRIPG